MAELFVFIKYSRSLVLDSYIQVIIYGKLNTFTKFPGQSFYHVIYFEKFMRHTIKKVSNHNVSNFSDNKNIKLSLMPAVVDEKMLVSQLDSKQTCFLPQYISAAVQEKYIKKF